MKINLPIIFLAVSLLNAITSWAQNPAQDILLFKDKDGVYLYTPSTSKEKLLYKATANQVFLNEPYKLVNDVLTFGFAGMVMQEMTNYAVTEEYYKDYYSVDMKTGKGWPSGKILYTLADDKLKIKTLAISPKGDTTLLQDSTAKWPSSSAPTKAATYNKIQSRFFSENKVAEKSVLSKKGNIYYVNKKDTTLLAKYNGVFDPHFRNGYYEPALAPSGDYSMFRYIPGVARMEETQSLQKADIKTKKVSIVKKGEFADIRFSKDGNFLLFIRHESEGTKLIWIYNAYILNLTTLQEKKIGKANSANWL